MPTGCEITAVTMMINFAGKKVTKDQAAKVMPRSYDPNKGFIGSPYREFPLGFWVAPNGVKPVVSHYLGTATNMTNCSLNAIKRKLIRSLIFLMILSHIRNLIFYMLFTIINSFNNLNNYSWN